MNEIICADCLEVLKSMPDKSVDLVLTDPPYGIDYQSARRIDRTEWKPKIANDKEPCVAWIADAARVLDDGGCLLCFCRWDVEDAFKKAIEGAGLIVRSQVIWDREGHGMGDLHAQFAPCHDIIWFATKGDYAFPGRRPESIIRSPRIGGLSLVHPNEKPVDLMRALIVAVSNEGDTILDPFCGSGTTCVAAKILGRKYIGIEISPVYAEIARKRVEQAQYEERLFARAA
jgi:site-specific DNA-methyltransferase (adenine-specific)